MWLSLHFWLVPAPTNFGRPFQLPRNCCLAYYSREEVSPSSLDTLLSLRTLPFTFPFDCTPLMVIYELYHVVPWLFLVLSLPNSDHQSVTLSFQGGFLGGYTLDRSAQMVLTVKARVFSESLQNFL